MAEWNTQESEDDSEAQGARSGPLWIRVGGWLLRTFWGFLAGNALALLFFFFAVAKTSGRTDNSGLLGAVIGLVEYPIIVAFVTLLWVVVTVLARGFQGQIVQALASLAICGLAALTINAMESAAIRNRSVRGERARAEADAHPDPKVIAKRAEMERRERDYAYGDRAARTPPAPAPYVPKVEPRKAEDDYSMVPEIHVSRPNGQVLLTNHSTQTLRIAAALIVTAGPSGCAELRAPDGTATGDAVVLKPRQAITLRRSDACPGTETAAVQLRVWNAQQQSTPFRLIHER